MSTWNGLAGRPPSPLLTSETTAIAHTKSAVKYARYARPSGRSLPTCEYGRATTSGTIRTSSANASRSRRPYRGTSRPRPSDGVSQARSAGGYRDRDEQEPGPHAQQPEREQTEAAECESERASQQEGHRPPRPVLPVGARHRDDAGGHPEEADCDEPCDTPGGHAQPGRGDHGNEARPSRQRPPLGLAPLRSSVPRVNFHPRKSRRDN